MKDIILVGYGGHAKSVADCIERMGEYKIKGYTEKESCESGYAYLGTDDSLEQYKKDGVEYAFICIGYMGKGNLRERLYKRIKELKYKLPVIVDPSAIIAKSANVGEGSFIGKGAIINTDTEIEKMCIINTKALIEHDGCVGCFSHVAVGAILCGGVRVGRSSFIGANTTIIQGIDLPERSFVPAGTVIRKETEIMKAITQGGGKKQLITHTLISRRGGNLLGA